MLGRRMLPRDQGSPLHHKLFLILRDAIMTGRYSPGEMMPTEEAFALQFGVSRITVRRALDSLVRANLIERRQGKGTFVLPEGMSQPVRMSLESITAQIVKVGATTRARVVEFGMVRPPPDVRKLFGLSPDATMQRAVRVRFDGREPLVHLTTFVADAVSRTYDRDDMERTPLFELIRRAGVKVASGEQVVGAALATPPVSEHLKLEFGAPLLRLVRILNDADGRPIEYLEMLAPPERFQLHFVIQPDDIESIHSRLGGGHILGCATGGRTATG